MEAEFAHNPADTSSEDDDYDQPWWGKWLGSGWVEKKKKRRTVIADCRRMLRYALDEGSQVPAALAEAIALIDHFLITTGRRPLSEVPQDVIAAAAESGAAGKARTAETVPSINEVILQAHNALSNLVAPATAQSLRATDPAIVLFGLPPIAKFAILGAIVCTVAFLGAVAKPLSGVLPDTDNKPQPRATPIATRAPSATASPATGRISPTPTPFQSSPTPNP